MANKTISEAVNAAIVKALNEPDEFALDALATVFFGGLAVLLACGVLYFVVMMVRDVVTK